MRMKLISAVALLCLAGLIGCGGGPKLKPAAPSDDSPSEQIPSWAKVCQGQIDEARKWDVPVAFENSIGMRFVLIPSGTFEMGSPKDEKGRRDDETLHRVTITTPYYMAIHEVTNAQYRRKESGHLSREMMGLSLNGGTQPVVYVDHTDATKYAAWLASREPGRIYSLPTEAQWERAARAGRSRSRFYWGNAESEAYRYANAYAPVTTKELGSSRTVLPRGDGHRVASPVGSYRPNGYGLYDVLGNAWEWCSDGWEPYPSGDARDPKGDASSGTRVLRGGSWSFLRADVRLADRARYVPTYAVNVIGFRVVCSVPFR